MATPKRFSVPRFLLFTALQFSAVLIAGRALFPDIWAAQLRAGPWAFLAVFLAMLGHNSFWEWGFHRYVLHTVVIPWLRKLATAHRLHHALTPIRLVPGEAGPGRIVLNRYPILEETQFESSAFPWYALIAFWIVFTPGLMVMQILLPRAPILLGGYAAVTWSLASYEVIHAVEHLPYEWWQRATEHPRDGRFWKQVYGFHHFHHANIRANEAIGGFLLGLPLADWVLGTYHQPQELLLDGRMATAKEFVVHPPRQIVAVMDRWAKNRESRILHRT